MKPFPNITDQNVHLLRHGDRVRLAAGEETCGGERDYDRTVASVVLDSPDGPRIITVDDAGINFENDFDLWDDNHWTITFIEPSPMWSLPANLRPDTAPAAPR